MILRDTRTRVPGTRTRGRLRVRKAAFILAAAGTGERLGLGRSKARARIAGKSLLELALEPVLARTDLDPVVAVLNAQDLEWGRALLPARVLVVQGGARRQDSVVAGLAALPSRAGWVLVHDVARPLLASDVMDRLLAALSVRGVARAVPAIPVADTVRGVDAQGGNLGVVNRACLRLVQTPQAFRVEALRAAHARILAEGVEVTDDASAVEALGRQVVFVEGDSRAFKVTRPEDLALLRAYLHTT